MYGTLLVPTAIVPIATYSAMNCQYELIIDAARKQRPKMMMEGTSTFFTPTRSTSRPMNGSEMAVHNIITETAALIAVRLQPNSAPMGPPKRNNEARPNAAGPVEIPSRHTTTVSQPR